MATPAVPFINIPDQNRSLRSELDDAVQQVIESARFILGPAVEAFEEEFAEYVGVKHCVGVNNGTSALHMALVANNVGHGDEVITTPHSWISTTWTISYVGATPVFVDIDPVTYNLDPKLVEAAITPRTKAILPVDLYGQVCDWPALEEIAERRNLVLIEDSAQAHGAYCGDRRAGSHGVAGCFSFYPGKNLGAFGEGGAVVTNDAEISDRIRQLRDHAQDGRHHHVEVGFNTRMEGLQGAVLSVKLPHLDGWNERRRQIAAQYQELLADLPQLKLPTAVAPKSHVFHLYSVQVLEGCRDQLRQQLAEFGVQSGVHYPTPIPFQPVYQPLGYQLGDFPVAEQVMNRCLSLPIFPQMTDAQTKLVSDALHKILA